MPATHARDSSRPVALRSAMVRAGGWLPPEADRRTWSKVAPSKRQSVISAPARSTPRSNAPLRSARIRRASASMQSCRMAPRAEMPLRSALSRSQPTRRAPRRSAPDQLVPLRMSACASRPGRIALEKSRPASDWPSATSASKPARSTVWAMHTGIHTRATASVSITCRLDLFIMTRPFCRRWRLKSRFSQCGQCAEATFPLRS